MGVLNTLMGRRNDGAPLSEAPRSFDSKNSEKDKNKEPSKGTQWSFTSLCNSAIKFFNRISEYAKTTEAEKSVQDKTSQQRLNTKPKAQEQKNGNNGNGGMGGFLRGLMPSGVFVEAKNVNTEQTLRQNVLFQLPKIGINRHQVSLPTANDVKKSAVKFKNSIGTKLGNAAEAFAGAYGAATEGLDGEGLTRSARGVASVASFFASGSGSPSGSPSVFSVQNLKSGLSFDGSQSMSATVRGLFSALSSGSRSSPSYGSRYGNSGLSFSAGFLSGGR